MIVYGLPIKHLPLSTYGGIGLKSKKGFFASALLALLSSVIVVLNAPSAAHATPGDSYFGLRNLNSGTWMRNETNNYVLLESDQGRRQEFRREAVSGTNFVRYINRETGRALGVDGASTTSGARLFVGEYDSNATNQQWYFAATSAPTASDGTGWAMIVNRKSNHCIGVNQGQTADGAQLRQFSCSSTARNQAWKQVDY
jgi:hypothetical protein